jgi:hypothetical protein
MYYYVREATFNHDNNDEFEGHAQGFCNKLEFLSECNDGRVHIDGLHSAEFGLGDTFTITCEPEHVLTGIKFIL